MSGAVRINNGTAVQLRVGVLQGIGPIGPPGGRGEQGRDGPPGPEGPTGPAGGFLNYASLFNITSTTVCAANTDQLISFATVEYDDLNAHTSTTAFDPTQPGDYMVSAWVNCLKPTGNAAGSRALIFKVAGAVVATKKLACIPTESTTLDLSFPYRFGPGDVLRCYVHTTDTVSISVDNGAIAFNRMGAGGKGERGDVGDTGPVGPQGPQGPKGDQGSAGGAYAHYSDLF